MAKQITNTWTLGNGPKLAAVATALGIAGADDDAKASALRVAVNGFTSGEMNEFVEELTNKVLISLAYKALDFQDPYSKAFFKTGTTISAATEIFENQLLTAHKYDKSKRMPDVQERANTLQTIIRTVEREYFTNTIQLATVKAAFASETAFGEWLSKQTKLLADSLQMRLFDFIQELIIDGVKNEITLAGTDQWDERFIAMNGISKNMEVPSNKYNLGFADPTDPANADLVRKQVGNRSRLYMIASTNVVNAFEGRVSTVKFHNAYFNISQYKGVLPSDQLDDDTIILLDEAAAQGYYRVFENASQFWAGNMTTEMFLHYWIVFGLIPWGLGVKLKFDAIAPAPAPAPVAGSEEPQTLDLDEAIVEVAKEDEVKSV